MSTITRWRPGMTWVTTASRPCITPPAICTVSPGANLLDDVQIFGAEQGAQLLDHGIGNGRPAGAKMHHPSNARRVVDLGQIGMPIEPGEHVVGEQGLNYPNGSRARGAGEADARTKHFDLFELPEVPCGHLLVFHLRTHAEPGQRRFRPDFARR